MRFASLRLATFLSLLVPSWGSSVDTGTDPRQACADSSVQDVATVAVAAPAAGTVRSGGLASRAANVAGSTDTAAARTVQEPSASRRLSVTAPPRSSAVTVSVAQTPSTDAAASAYRGLASQAPSPVGGRVGGGAEVQSMMSIGNSLTDRLYPYFQPIAALAGKTLRAFLYSEPGAGTYVYQNRPTGRVISPGGAFTNVQDFVRGRAFDHVTMQPYPNMPCVPSGYWAANPDAGQRSDAANILDVWNDAYANNKDVQLWVYWQWPKPATMANGQQPPSWQNCFTGQWNRDRAIWNVSKPAATWGEAIDEERRYQEAVRAALAAKHPDRRPPYIIPGGLVMKNLKEAVVAGKFPGLAATETAFLGAFFENGGSDDHPRRPNGEWALALTFYACVFQADPRGLPVPPGLGITWTRAQANFIEQVVHDSVANYALSGYRRR